ncbi:hypothetical protein RND81_10G012800 [Saponaria officinalis]|uniref:Pseudouridine synthase RsuA/RluA-like domain-containing protein n=1 Tax=Saponaria officinalis TaxID=3572 RepID=A0AAW1HX95_SAPOF
MTNGAANMGSIITNTFFSTLRRTTHRFTGAPTILRRTLLTNHHLSAVRRQQWCHTVSSFKTQSLTFDTLINSASSVIRYVADLIQFGAVYYALVCPVPPVTATDEQVQLYQQFTSPKLLKQRSSIKGKTVREAQKTFKVTFVDERFEVGTYLRVHVHPKRFPRCYEIDWKSRIVAVSESYVVLDKPSGTSVGGTSDNIKECCATFATRTLNLTSPLLTTHQIDNCTEGCVVLARTKEYCSVFHKKIRRKEALPWTCRCSSSMWNNDPLHAAR